MVGLKRATAALGAAVLWMAAGPAAAQDSCKGEPEVKQVTFVADWLPWASQGPFYAAQQNGFYKEAGLEVDIQSPASGSDPLKLVARQRADFAMSYVPDVMIARDAGVPVVSVAALLRPFVQGLIVSPEAGLTGPKDLKGKTVGVSSIPAIRAYFNSMVEAAGLGADEVTVVDPGYSNVTMLMAGNLEAISGLSYSELATANAQREKDGKAPFAFWPFSDYGVPQFYFMLLAANEDWVKEHPNTACHFLAATARGFDAFKANPKPIDEFFAKNNEIFALPDHETMTKMTLGDWADASGKLFVQDEATWKAAQDWAMKMKLLQIGSEPASYFSNAYLPQ